MAQQEIYNYLWSSRNRSTTNDLAEIFDITNVTAAKAVKKLRKLDEIHYEERLPGQGGWVYWYEDAI